jgi:hypothetical protein
MVARRVYNELLGLVVVHRKPWSQERGSRVWATSTAPHMRRQRMPMPEQVNQRRRRARHWGGRHCCRACVEDEQVHEEPKQGRRCTTS